MARLIGCLLLCIAGLVPVRAVPAVEAELLADTQAIVPGKPFIAGLLLRMEPGWHTYWQNPGDSGIATSIKWQLPPGFEAKEIQWPVPDLTFEEGDLLTHTYSKEVLLLVPITVPANISAQAFTFSAKVSWLACKESCVPGDANVELALPVASSATPANENLFSKYKARLPRPVALSGLKVKTAIENGTFVLDLSGAEEAAQLFPIANAGQSFSHVSEQPLPGGGKRFTFKMESGQSTSTTAVLAVGQGDGRQGWIVEWQPKPAPAAAATDGKPRWLLFIFGFLGGLILNIMPCVLPVIALKILGFVHQAGQSPQRVFRLGLAFVAGVFTWFLALAGLVVLMKTAGHQINWAFQFQNPVFVLVMFGIVLVFALNLLGAFELVLPSKANTKLNQLVGHEGYWGAFLHGVFATLLATPCTAPFLAPALGFALGQPAPIIFAMFAVIAAGMSLPYFLLTARPAWLRYLPRPGIWMVRLKQIMGVLLLATAVWLGGISYRQWLPRTGEAFSVQLEKALAGKRIVFVDFTADWCVNCKVNERLVLNSQAVQNAFKDKDVLFLKADWTRGDADITALLKRFGRAGVPLYVIYPANDRNSPIVLPELLSRDTVLEALERAK